MAVWMCTALAALPRCIITPSEAGEGSARRLAQPITVWSVCAVGGDVTAAAVLS